MKNILKANISVLSLFFVKKYLLTVSLLEIYIRLKNIYEIDTICKTRIKYHFREVSNIFLSLL